MVWSVWTAGASRSRATGHSVRTRTTGSGDYGEAAQSMEWLNRGREGTGRGGEEGGKKAGGEVES